MKCFVLLILFFCGGIVANASLPTIEPQYNVSVSTAVVYGQGQVNAPSAADKDLLLDLYQPIGVAETGSKSPVLMIIHGGAFILGSRLQPSLVEIAQNMASRGYVVASIDYRLVPDQPVPSKRMAPISDVLIVPGMDEETIARAEAAIAAIDDSLTALDWLKNNAEQYNIDTNMIGLLGGSAGAFTSVHLAYVLDNYGVSAPDISFVVDLWGGSLIPGGDRMAAAAHLENGEAPIFIVHGTADTTVDIEFSELLAQRAEKQRVTYEFYPVEGGDHGFEPTDFFNNEISPGVTIFDRMMSWSRSVIFGKRHVNINYGMVGSWFNPETPGQGFLLDIDPIERTLFVGWFSYDTIVSDDVGEIPGAEQRWFSAIGEYVGNHAELIVYQSRDGLFNQSTPVSTSIVGQLHIDFEDCLHAELSFDLEQLSIAGSHHITRLLPDAICQQIEDGLLQIPSIEP